jgi:hypothetical protein
MQLNFIPLTLAVPTEEMKKIKSPELYALRVKPTRLNKRWSRPKGERYLIPNFRITVLFENREKEEETFSDIIYKQNQKITNVIIKALMENFQLTNREQLEYSWYTAGKYVKIRNDLKFDTDLLFSNIIIDEEHEIDLWISSIEILLRH